MAELPETMRAVRFSEWGDRSVLHVEQVPVPEVEAGRVLVRVRAAGINPGESAIRQGLFDGEDPSKLPPEEQERRAKLLYNQRARPAPAA